MTGAAGTALCVVCETYAGDGFPPLVGAVAQMDEIVGLLEGLGYEARKVGAGILRRRRSMTKARSGPRAGSPRVTQNRL